MTSGFSSSEGYERIRHSHNGRHHRSTGGKDKHVINLKISKLVLPHSNTDHRYANSGISRQCHVPKYKYRIIKQRLTPAEQEEYVQRKRNKHRASFTTNPTCSRNHSNCTATVHTIYEACPKKLSVQSEQPVCLCQPQPTPQPVSQPVFQCAPQLARTKGGVPKTRPKPRKLSTARPRRLSPPRTRSPPRQRTPKRHSPPPTPRKKSIHHSKPENSISYIKSEKTLHKPDAKPSHNSFAERATTPKSYGDSFTSSVSTVSSTKIPEVQMRQATSIPSPADEESKKVPFPPPPTPPEKDPTDGYTFVYTYEYTYKEEKDEAN